MAYNRTHWVDQLCEYPNRYKVEHVSGSYYRLSPHFGEIYREGTPLDAEHLNNMEEGIDNLYNQIDNIAVDMSWQNVSLMQLALEVLLMKKYDKFEYFENPGTMDFHTFYDPLHYGYEVDSGRIVETSQGVKYMLGDNTTKELIVSTVAYDSYAKFYRGDKTVLATTVHAPSSIITTNGRSAVTKFEIATKFEGTGTAKKIFWEDMTAEFKAGKPYTLQNPVPETGDISNYMPPKIRITMQSPDSYNVSLAGFALMYE